MMAHQGFSPSPLFLIWLRAHEKADIFFSLQMKSSDLSLSASSLSKLLILLLFLFALLLFSPPLAMRDAADFAASC